MAYECRFTEGAYFNTAAPAFVFSFNFFNFFTFR